MFPRTLAIVVVAALAAIGSAPGCKMINSLSGTTPEPAADAAPAADATAAAAAAAATPAAEPVVVDHTMTPEAFVQAVAASDLLEINLGRMAMAKADEQTVKDFGHRMVTNHTAIQVIIGKIAVAQEITLPTEIAADDTAIVTSLEALSGEEFDKAYMAYMADENPKILAMYRWQYDNCTDPTVKPFASQTMPIIGTHARLAEALNAEVNKEAIRLAAEQKAAELKAAEEAKAAAAAEAAAAAAKKKPAGKKPPAQKKPAGAP
jgi:putative membrane protein